MLFMNIIHVNDIIPVISTTLLKKTISAVIIFYVSLLSTMPPKPSYTGTKNNYFAK